jgi:hypothetical protein
VLLPHQFAQSNNPNAVLTHIFRSHSFLPFSHKFTQIHFAPKPNITYLLSDHDLEESSELKDSLLGKSIIELAPELMGLGQVLGSAAAFDGTIAESEGRDVISGTGTAICRSFGW